MVTTGNQALQLLWVHFVSRRHYIGLTEDEVITLGLQLVAKYESLTTIYKDHLIPQSKSELVDILRSDKGASGLFQDT